MKQGQRKNELFEGLKWTVSQFFYYGGLNLISNTNYDEQPLSLFLLWWIEISSLS